MPKGKPNPPMNEKDFCSLLLRSGDCLLWQGALTTDGYGRFWHKGVEHSAHVWAYEHWIGPVPLGLELDHLCRNRACCEPTHLEAVTHRVNCQRGRGSIPACPRGHPYDAENTYYSPRGGRFCRACNRAAAKRLRERRKL